METWTEFVAYIASGMAFATFWMKMIIPLRVLGLGSNVLFVVYALSAGLAPMAILNIALLPLNLYRLIEMLNLTRKVREAFKGEFSVEGILPFMSGRKLSAGEAVFRKGDPAREIFYIVEGEMYVEELGITRSAGELVGEIGMFSPSRTRTQTVVCKTDCKIRWLSSDKVEQLYYQSPDFGLYLIKMITARLTAEAS